MESNNRKHVHSYARIKSPTNDRKDLYRCTFPTCFHTAPKHLLIGKLALCSLCAEEFILTGEALKRAKPHCEKCYKGKRGERARALRESAQDISEDVLRRAILGD